MSERAAAAVSGARAAVQALAREGVRYVFGLPGTTVMDLIDALTSPPGEIRYISVRHEQVAAFMADGFARGSGELAVCMASRGPGAANLSIGVHNAHAEAIPVLALVGQIPDGYAQRDSFEEMDLLTFFRPITKWQTEIHVPQRIPELVQRACRTALAGRPGGVLVSLPLDVQTEQIDPPSLQPRWRPGRPAPDPDDLRRAAGLLTQSRRPVIVIGGGIPSHDPSVIALAEALQAAVVTTQLRKSQYPNRAGTYVGGLGFGALPATISAVTGADVVLALGVKMSEFTTNRWTLLPADATLIHVDVDEHVLGRVYIPELGLPADTALTAELLLDRVRAHDDEVASGVRRERLAGLRACLRAEATLPDGLEPKPGVVSSHSMVTALRQFVQRPELAIVSDAPGFGTWMHRYLDFEHPDSFYGAAGGSMGWGLGAAMGIKLARPETIVLMIAGDGSFWMVAQDLETAVRENIPIVVIVMNNYAFGNTRDRQRFAFGGRYAGVFYDNPDFAAFARLLGAHGERVECDADVLPAIERAIASGQPALIDVIQDAAEGLPPDLVPPGVSAPS